MKVKTKVTFYSNGEFIKPGTVLTMDEPEAKVNIARKFVESAEDLEAPAPAPVQDPAPAPAETESDEATRLAGQSAPAEASAVVENDPVQVEDAEIVDEVSEEIPAVPETKPAATSKPAPVKNKGKGK